MLFARQNHTCCHAIINRLFDIRRIGRKEQIRLEGFQIGGHIGAAEQRCAGDIQAIMLNGMEYAQTCLRAVAAHDDHLNRGTVTAFQAVQVEEGFHQLKSRPRQEDIRFMLPLVFRIGLQTMLFKDGVFFLQVEQSAG